MEAPIGVFDSGVGGLTVARELARRFPGERILYLADQAHVPYGGRPLSEVRGFAQALSDFLVRSGAKLVVMACNISSATALESVAARLGARRVLGVIEPGARAAIAASASGRIGVLATQGTVATHAYQQAIRRLAPSALPLEVACPRFVPLVEAGLTEGAEAVQAAKEYLEPLLAHGTDTVVLGCTHYPFLLSTLQQPAPQLNFIDPARATVDALGGLLAPNRSPQPSVAPELCTTGDPQTFARQLALFWPELAPVVRHVPWDRVMDQGATVASRPSEPR